MTGNDKVNGRRWYKSAWIWTVAVPLIAAIAGSAIWEFAIRPAFIFVSNAGLALITLGSESLENAIYIEVAQGFRELPATSLLAIFIALLAGILAGTAFARRLSERLYRIARSRSDSNYTASDESTGQDLAKSDKRVRRIRKFGWIIDGLVVFTIALSLLMVFRITYVNKAIAHYEQLHDIVSPHVTEQDRIRFHSEFAQIDDSDDYKRIVGRLESIARENGQNVPEFDIY